MKRMGFAFVLLLAMSSAAQTATLTITPNKQTYVVGEQIVLDILGDSEGESTNGISGSIRFEPGLATYVSSTQSQLTSFGGAVSWALGSLVGGPGFADAFSQAAGGGLIRVDAPLTATVTLVASAPGTLHYSWDGAPIAFQLDFFSLSSAPGGSVTIVPEPATVLLLASGLAVIAGKRRARSRVN